MLSRLKNYLKKPAPERPRSTGETLVYAVGDVHGRLDLLNSLIEKIRADMTQSQSAGRPMLVFLGDYIDRGPASRGVVERLIELRNDPAWDVHLLKGNHDAQMLVFLEDPLEGPGWGEFGGLATLQSYGVDLPVSRNDPEAWEAVRDRLAATLPAAHRAFFEGLELSVECGDYIFVHAGLRPGIPIEQQDPKDLMWIREEFLYAKTGFEKVVVHGHTPAEAPFMGDFRINVDTGAYITGRLTCVRLLGLDRDFIQVGADKPSFAASKL